MTTVVTTPAETVAPIIRRRTHVEMARWSTVALILFMMWVPFSGPFDPAGRFIHFLADWLFVAFILYMAIQSWETASRASTNSSGFFEDNGLAFVALIIGIGVFILMFSGSLRLAPDQTRIMLQCIGWGGLDFVFGVLISQRIASSAKERVEE